MNFNNEKTHFPFYLNFKCLFSSILVLNCFIGLIYFSHRNDQYFQTQIFSNSRTSQSIKSIDLIKNILENEYNRSDLFSFYTNVSHEFSLGLKCVRATRPKLNFSTNSRPRRTSLNTFKIENDEICHNQTIDLLVMIISKSENYKTRDAIRRTWASGKPSNFSSINIRFVFLIDFDEKIARNIELENEIFHDIVQVELPQQYTLVTHRVLSILEWSFRFCRSAKFLFKTDDDIFINTFLLLKFVQPMLNQTEDKSFRLSSMFIYGYKHKRPSVFRNANDPVGIRYVVTEDEFPCAIYPDFLSGFGYLIPKKTRDALLYSAYQDPNVPFRISDVYFTGILPDYLSVDRQSMSDYSIRYEGNCENFFDQPNSLACAAGAHRGESNDVFMTFHRYWQHIRQKF